MKIFKPFLLLLVGATLFSCDNEVEINAEYEEVTTVYGLLEITTDTQFVKITRTFLDDEQSAVQLAGQADRIYYESLDVVLEEYNSTGTTLENEFQLSKTTVPKEEGLFTQESNEVYFTTERINSSRVYRLRVTKPDGTITRGLVKPTNGMGLLNPDISRRQKIRFVSSRQEIQNYTFIFSSGTNVGEFDVKLRFKYGQVRDENGIVDTISKSFVIPITRFENPGLESSKIFRFEYEGSRFFAALEREIPAALNSPLRLIPDQAFELTISAADGEYYLYREVNGPIEGLAQTRPEFSNVENGIGLFASRHIRTVLVDMEGDTKNLIEILYGNRDERPVDYRGFDPR